MRVERSKRRLTQRHYLVAVLLALVTLAVFWPAVRCPFINYDDPEYVADNPHVQQGLTWRGLVWAFARLHGEETYWHPLTWVSHMADCQMFGLNPAGHHFVNVLLHTVNTVLVFLVFWRMTGARWRCALLAGLFALHPLQVDTVAWVAERKNLLSTLFWLLTLWFYVRYAEQRQARNPRSRGWYALALLAFLCGLMCKPVLVTLPFVLLLMDYWPLERFPSATARSLVLEKLPFLGLAAVSCAITIAAHLALGSMLNAASGLPLGARVGNAVVSYVRYLAKTAWPSNLAVFYPLPASWPLGQVVACGLLLLAASGLVIAAAQRRRYLLVGWFWFVGVLVPFSGLIQAGAQAMADRFAYVPLIGLFIVPVWGLAECCRRMPRRARGCAAAAGFCLAAFAALTSHQLGYWRDGEALFRHAIATTKDNYVAYNVLGLYLSEEAGGDPRRGKPRDRRSGRPPDAASAREQRTHEAAACFATALRLKPNYVPSRIGLGNLLLRSGNASEALEQFTLAAQAEPGRAEPQNNLGLALSQLGRLPEAIEHYTRSLRLDPNNAAAHCNLGLALSRTGQTDTAIAHLNRALELGYSPARVRTSLGGVLARSGRLPEAILQYREALRLQPDILPAINNLAWILATANEAGLRNGPEAVRLAEHAVALTRRQGAAELDILAAAYAESGRFAEATRTIDEAIAAARAAGGDPAELEARRRLYQSEQPPR